MTTRNGTSTVGSPIGTVIEVRGAWRGAVGDPARQFAGRVSRSDLPGIMTGDSATVTFQVPQVRTTGAGEHGTYTLAVGDRHLPLMRFTCHDTGMTGHEGNDDTAEATWQAVPLPA